MHLYAKNFMIFKSQIIYGSLNRTFNRTPLNNAVIKGHKEIVELLIKQPGIDLESKSI